MYRSSRLLEPEIFNIPFRFNLFLLGFLRNIIFYFKNFFVLSGFFSRFFSSDFKLNQKKLRSFLVFFSPQMVLFYSNSMKLLYFIFFKFFQRVLRKFKLKKKSTSFVFFENVVKQAICFFRRFSRSSFLFCTQRFRFNKKMFLDVFTSEQIQTKFIFHNGCLKPKFLICLPCFVG
jgi:hypothetical protein